MNRIRPSHLKPINCESGTWGAGIGEPAKYAAIHVYATHEQAVMTPMHTEDAFRKAAEVVSVEKASITWNRNAKIPLVRTENGLQGLLWSQINLLYSERARVKTLLRASGSELKPVLPQQDSSGNCGPVI